jgi:hypothetical protein
MSSNTTRKHVVAVAATIAVVGAAGAVFAGTSIAEATWRSSGDVLGVQYVLAGWVGAAAVLIPISAILIRLVRELEDERRRATLSVAGWIMLVPGGLWTLLAVGLATSPEDSDGLGIVDLLPEWAAVAIPLFVASAALSRIDKDADASTRWRLGQPREEGQGVGPQRDCLDPSQVRYAHSEFAMELGERSIVAGRAS